MDASEISNGSSRGQVLRTMFRRHRSEPVRQPADASIRGATAVSSHGGSRWRSRWHSMRSFWPKEDGETGLETALAVALVVAAFAGLIEIVNTTFESDRMNRAARAAADATALDGNADACAAIRRELRLADDFDCSAWTITVHRRVLPSKLDTALGAGSPGTTGDMVLVRIDWSRAPWSLANVIPAANAAEDAGESGSAENAGGSGSAAARATALVSRTALGLARSEPLR